MKLKDIVAVIGLKNECTELAEALCRTLGIDVFYAVKRTDPTQRIDAMSDDAEVTAPFDQLAPTVFRLGLMAADSLADTDMVDCNLTEARELFAHLLGWLVHRLETESDVPDGWPLIEGGDGLERYPTGKVLAGSQVVVHVDGVHRLLQIPAPYAGFIANQEGFCI